MVNEHPDETVITSDPAFNDEAEIGALVPAWDRAGLVPPRRLGALLSTARAAKGLTITDVADSVDSRFTAARLASIERGTTHLDDISLRQIVALYGIDAGELVPDRSRLIIDLSEGVLRVPDAGAKAHLGPEASRSDVLSRYLAMVYRMRDIDPGTSISLRVEDLDVLGVALQVGSGELTADLDALMSEVDGPVAWRSRLLRRKFLVPAAGLLVAFSGVTALLLVQSDDASTPVVSEPTSIATMAPTTTVAPMPPAVKLGPATAQERGPGGQPGPIVVRGN